MGARAFMSPRLMQIPPRMGDRLFGYVGSSERASPGEGYPAAHIQEQSRILRTALDLEHPGLDVSEEGSWATGSR